MLSSNPDRINVLLIEDDEDDYILTRDWLRSAGGNRYELTWARNYDQALEALNHNGYDICLLDYRLGGRTGLELLADARAKRLEVPATILLTGQGDMAVDLEAMEAGVADYLVKGEITSNALERTVRYVVSQARVLKALDRSETHFRSVVENVLDLITIYETDGSIRYQSPSVTQLLGFSSDEMAISRIVERIHHDDMPEIRAAFNDAMQHPGKPVSVLFRIKDNQNIWRCLESIGRNLLQESGMGAFLVTSRDTTTRRQAEDDLKETARQLERSNAELRRFAYVASHDLKEPLRAISGYVQLLERRYKDRLDPDANDFIRYTVDATVQMNRLITDLLEYSRLESTELNLDTVDCNTVIDRALMNLKGAIDAAGAEILLERTLPNKVVADRVKLLQVFQNLLSNAIKFHRDKTPVKILISAKEDEHDWIFCVGDNGIGIEPDDIHRIMGLFKRLHDSSDYPGTGIGLAICRKAVEQHGGKIWVESKPGEGSTFFFSIPKPQNNV